MTYQIHSHPPPPSPSPSPSPSHSLPQVLSSCVCLSDAIREDLVQLLSESLRHLAHHGSALTQIQNAVSGIAFTHTHTHTYTHTYTYTYTHTHTHIHIHTYTHTHTRINIIIYVPTTITVPIPSKLPQMTMKKLWSNFNSMHNTLASSIP